MNFILAAMSGAERIFEIMDEKVEIDEGSVTLTNVRNEYGKYSSEWLYHRHCFNPIPYVLQSACRWNRIDWSIAIRTLFTFIGKEEP